ncbi:MAG: hypothetical protein K1X89_03305 [Myxococcaceae bacterium]|nr:hypothetical protein [Myxococcaceae bacterium]
MRALVLAVVAIPAMALAGSVYLNGVKIDGVTGQKFEKATVTIDEKGNVLIDAPAYQVRQVDGTPPPQPQPTAAVTAQLTKKYFLVTEQTAVGMTEYDVDVYLNNKFWRKLKSDEEQLVSDVTKNLVPGKNTVLLVAKKRAGESRRSYSKDHVLRVIIGEAEVAGDRVTLTNPVVRFERSAAETQDVTQELSFTTR